jgi:ribosomal protein S18 acetylase RimI-like enzyme
MKFRPATPSDEADLARLFLALAQVGDERLFHPHPLSAEAARTVCHHRETNGPHDEYHVAISETPNDSVDKIVGYGILRGWTEGYEIPSLGIAVHPKHRGFGIARAFMNHLHAVAAARGAKQVRLKVYRSNTAAVRLYQSLSYAFQPWSETEMVGFYTLAQRAAA